MPIVPLALLEAIFALSLGGLIYLGARPEGLWMFDWARALGAADWLETARAHGHPLLARLPDWVRFSLPDALWAFAFASTMSWAWQQRVSRTSAGWLALGPALAIGLELGQALGVVQGTFDWCDLALSVVGCALGLRRLRLIPLPQPLIT